MVTVPTRQTTSVAFARGPVLAIAGLAGLALLLTSGRYAGGFDELYFLVAGRDHLSWGYFDQPPLIPALAAAMDWLAPGSLVVLRLPMTLAAAAGVVVTALIAREFGGGRGAQAMAAGCYATSSIVIVSHWIGTYVLDPFLWTVVAWLLVRWTRTRRDGLLVWAGVVTAVSLETKFLIPALWAAVLLAAAVFGPRELLRRPKLWLGAAIAVVVTIPTLVWQAAHGWPYTHMSEVVAAEFPGYGPWVRDGLLGAGIGVGVLALLYGVWRLLRSAELRPYRYLGAALILVALAVVATQGRSYYLMGCYAVPFAAAATELTRRNLVSWWKAVAWPVFVLSAVVTLVALPVWPASARTSFGPFSLGSAFAQGELPQQDLAKAIGQTYAALPPAVRARTAVYSEIYPFAAVTEFYGAPYGIHTVYSGHRAYWYFGPPPESADAVLFAGFDPGLLRPYFAHETQVVDGLVWEYDGRTAPWSQIWPALKRQ
ncbi:glycosyltransferase family 39 protein [Amycolatopsis sp., V23-08]|uniref:Glycosyltransferase family 39 protein n=1 Tax=Amycolatopsis heterodermiae TaxID=3110235 RepID=A0ABU5RBY0_9PSEU|nr:glycosyltransferase family 39 protein [Amycolatopsis sp., V23-08]MEA5363750.1 glycosyltransferase family 39 protein [Amycolatopsis sp., V23-08]